MPTRIIDIECKFKCCIDDEPVFGLEHSRKFHQEEHKPFFKTTLKEWGEIMEDYAETVALYEGTLTKCQRFSTSFFACEYEGIVTLLKEIPEMIKISFSELEEMIYDIYLKKYHVRLIPTSVTDAVAYMQEYGMPRSKKIPARGIDIEKYCIGVSWCFDTISHANTFNKRYPKVASILSKLEFEVE